MCVQGRKGEEEREEGERERERERPPLHLTVDVASLGGVEWEWVPYEADEGGAGILPSGYM